MKGDINKLRIFKNYSITIRSNKIIFGHPSFENNHLTFHFGSNSGKFDFHLTHNQKGTHYTLLKIGHAELYGFLGPLAMMIIQSVLTNLKTTETEFLRENGFKIYKLNTVTPSNGDVLQFKKRGAINFDTDDEVFRNYVNELQKQSYHEEIDWDKLIDSEDFVGYVLKGEEKLLIAKSAWTNGKILVFNDVDLELKSILNKVLGIDNYNRIIKKIEEAMNFLNLNDCSNESEWLSVDFPKANSGPSEEEPS